MVCRWVYDVGGGFFLQCFFPGIFFLWGTEPLIWTECEANLILLWNCKSLFSVFANKELTKSIILMLKVCNPCNISRKRGFWQLAQWLFVHDHGLPEHISSRTCCCPSFLSQSWPLPGCCCCFCGTAVDPWASLGPRYFPLPAFHLSTEVLFFAFS